MILFNRSNTAANLVIKYIWHLQVLLPCGVVAANNRGKTSPYLRFLKVGLTNENNSLFVSCSILYYKHTYKEVLQRSVRLIFLTR
jgi:hypothetical protein